MESLIANILGFILIVVSAVWFGVSKERKRKKAEQDRVYRETMERTNEVEPGLDVDAARKRLHEYK